MTPKWHHIEPWAGEAEWAEQAADVAAGHAEARFDAPEEDQERLKPQLERVKLFMLRRKNEWLTKAELCTAGGSDWAAISARVRDLRKPRFGGYEIEQRRVKGGLFEYRLRLDQGNLF